MKTTLMLLLLGAVMHAQPDFNAIINSINKGDVATFTNYMDQEVELTIGESDDTYTKEKATAIIRQFFSKNTPQNCTIVHNGAAKNKDSYYCIGKLKAGGNEFRLYMYCKKTNDQYLIQEMRLEEK